MILPGHVAAPVLASRYLNIDCRLAVIAGLMPDLVDKPLLYVLHVTQWGRVPAHSLLALGASTLGVALAGVMGGLESEVTAATTDILLESANFDFINNRRTAKLLNLFSEASTRFGKRVDPELTVKALARACQLMEELAGGRVEPAYADLYPGRRERTVVDLRLADVPRILGVDIG